MPILGNGSFIAQPPRSGIPQFLDSLDIISLDNAFAVAVLEFLAGAAGTGIVTSGQLILDDRCTRLLGTSVLLGGSLLVAVYDLLLTDLLF